MEICDHHSEQKGKIHQMQVVVNMNEAYTLS